MEEDHRRDHAADLDDEHDRVAEERARVELEERVLDRREDDLAAEDGLARSGHRCLLVESEVELENVHARLAEEAEPAAVGVVGDQLLHALQREPAHASRRVRPAGRVRRRDVRVDARSGRRDGVDRDVADREPGLYGRSSFRIAVARCRTAFARSGFVGPRFAKVVAAALYSGAVAEGRGWKYWGFVKACAASFDPTTLPSRSTRLPFALSANASCANPVNTIG